MKASFPSSPSLAIMNYYELTYLISPEIKEENIKKLIEEINSFIQKEKGTITKSENPFPETLAYPIKKQRTASLVSSEFYLDPEKIEDLRKKLKKETEILRFLLVSKKISEKKRIDAEPVKDNVLEDKPTALSSEAPEERRGTDKKEKVEKKVELKEIEKKLEEILNE